MATGSARSALLLPLLLLFLALGQWHVPVQSADYVLAGSHEWRAPWDRNHFRNWATSIVFYPGDSITFVYDKDVESVHEVDEAGFKACTASHPIRLPGAGSGSTRVLLFYPPGERFFISGNQASCAAGARMSVLVNSSSAVSAGRRRILQSPPDSAPPAGPPPPDSTPPAPDPLTPPIVPPSAPPSAPPVVVDTPPPSAPPSTPPSPPPSSPPLSPPLAPPSAPPSPPLSAPPSTPPSPPPSSPPAPPPVPDSPPAPPPEPIKPPVTPPVAPPTAPPAQPPPPPPSEPPAAPPPVSPPPVDPPPPPALSPPPPAQLPPSPPPPAEPPLVSPPAPPPVSDPSPPPAQPPPALPPPPENPPLVAPPPAIPPAVAPPPDLPIPPPPTAPPPAPPPALTLPPTSPPLPANAPPPTLAPPPVPIPSAAPPPLLLPPPVLVTSSPPPPVTRSPPPPSGEGGQGNGSAPPSSSSTTSSNNTAVIAGVVVGVILLIGVLAAAVICCYCRRLDGKESTDLIYPPRAPPGYESGGAFSDPQKYPSLPGGMSSASMYSDSDKPAGGQYRQKEGALLFTLQDLQRATRNFSKDLELGSGGFGTVYKGYLDDGTVVAIKRAKPGGTKQDLDQFQNEVTILTQLNHRNLVKLIGFSLETEHPMLVYEFVPNGTLSDHLLGSLSATTVLDWNKRLQIAIETAEALKYLHFSASPPIFHRDVKSANILLDDNFSAKVADFGLSKLVPMHQTHVSTVVKGTPGYLDPEYYHNFQLTDKTDVYSYGVVLLELLTSEKPVDLSRNPRDANLAVRSIPLIKAGRVAEILDPRLGVENNPEALVVIEAVAKLAVACLVPSRDNRPSMKEVVAMLENISKGPSPSKTAADYYNRHQEEEEEEYPPYSGRYTDSRGYSESRGYGDSRGYPDSRGGYQDSRGYPESSRGSSLSPPDSIVIGGVQYVPAEPSSGSSIRSRDSGKSKESSVRSRDPLTRDVHPR